MLGAGDEEADAAGAFLVLDCLGDGDVGQPATALEAAVELPDALLLDAVRGPDGHERSPGDEADEQADDDRRSHLPPPSDAAIVGSDEIDGFGTYDSKAP
ncbi:MAG TPA: hypothetical protein VHA34_03970, partial [Actinomycetes bacterium]|nr:hypothetical protein [Actinomycetes bacterium]